ncbi:hypothetical protein BDW60DRAFT_198209 [Aspergillus nidulans var. acristatus]
MKVSIGMRVRRQCLSLMIPATLPSLQYIIFSRKSAGKLRTLTSDSDPSILPANLYGQIFGTIYRGLPASGSPSQSIPCTALHQIWYPCKESVSQEWNASAFLRPRLARGSRTRKTLLSKHTNRHHAIL